MNRTVMIARLTRDAEIKYTQGERPMAIAHFSVANNREFKNKDGNYDADFYNCVAMGKPAEIIEKFASAKGTQIGLEGRFQNNNWTDKEGVKHYDFQFNIQNVTLIEKSNAAGRPAPAATAGDGFMNIPDGVEDEGLPF